MNRVGRLGHPEELEPASSWRRAEPLPKVAAQGGGGSQAGPIGQVVNAQARRLQRVARTGEPLPHSYTFTSDASPLPKDQSSALTGTRLMQTSSRRTPSFVCKSSATRL